MTKRQDSPSDVGPADGTQGDKLFAHYHLGPTTIFAARCDPRFSYTLYVPRRIAQMDTQATRIIIAMHGTGRMQSLYRDLFAEFCEYHNCIALAPLFPANILGDGNLSGYKYLVEADIRYDLVVQAMIGEVQQIYDLQPHPILIFGFSGGAHFAHRYTLLHPETVMAASIGAPGIVTLADPDKPWWTGTANAEHYFDRPIDLAGLRGKPVHFVVGNADRENWEITLEPGDARYMPGINDSGADRRARIRSLRDSFARAGALTRLDIVPEAAHDVTHIIHCTRAFFSDVLAGRFEADQSKP